MLGRAQIQCPTVQVCLYACNVCRSIFPKNTPIVINKHCACLQ